MLRAFKYRLYPTKEQQALIDKTFDACRLVYNLGLEIKIYAWKNAARNISSYDLKKQLPDLKEAYPWLKEVDSQALQSSVIKIDNSFKGFFDGKGFPKFKGKKGIQSFQCPTNARKVDWSKSLLTIPKIKDIPIILSRKFEGEIRTISISKTKTGKYFASILVNTKDQTLDKPPINERTTVGIDLGIKSFAISSDGKKYEPNQYLKYSLSRLKCLQRRASKKKKGGQNWNKANQRIARLYEGIINQRIDFIHKVTTSLVRDSQTDTIVIEDLNVSGMIKNKKLARSVSDASFGEFSRQLKYKSQWHGKNLLIIGRFDPSSKRCSDCGEINKELTLNDREWTCKCGSHHDRDLNAAKNIKWFGLNNSGVGGSGEPVESRRLRRVKKQELNTKTNN